MSKNFGIVSIFETIQNDRFMKDGLNSQLKMKTKEGNQRNLGSDAAEPAEGERPTLKTIAFMAGLGVTTVSRALKDAPEIGQATKNRVQLIAKQIGYRPNRAGVRLRTGKTNVISLVLNAQSSIMGLTSNMVYGISEVLSQTPYHLTVTPYSLENDPMQPIRYIVETGSADGIIMSRTEPNDPRVRYLTEHGIPFATHGRTEMGIEHPFHDFDNEAFAYLSVKSLLAKGRRRIAMLAGPSPSVTYYRHLDRGFSRAMEEGALRVRLLFPVSMSIPRLAAFATGWRRSCRDQTARMASSAAVAARPSLWSPVLKLPD